MAMPSEKSCPNSTPSWFVGHWRDWHRGHGCTQDDGKPRSTVATTEIEQHEANAGTGFLTDAELGFLRAATTSGDTMLVRALNELVARRSRVRATGFLTEAERTALRETVPLENTLLVRALDELHRRATARHAADNPRPEQKI